ncbi:MAG: non-ribosomal peptide synthetase [Clostridia bacterium]|nr:non-ribosomal peptide synthetase [Clostridia bacterium]
MNNRYELTFPENNIYLVEKFNKNTSMNTIAGLLQIKSKFDEKICNKIVNKLIELNDALRIKIFEEDNSVYQIFEDYIYEDVEYFDMSKKSQEDIENFFEINSNTPFDFLNNKLYDIKIVRYNNNDGCVFVKLHHIISDAWTFGQVANQLLKMYDNAINNIHEEANKPSYIDFIESEKEYTSSEKYLKDEQFWREYLKDIKAPVSLKTSKKKLNTRANRYSITLDKETNDKIVEYIKVNKISAYTLFLGALATYIYRIKNENDFIIGTPVLNRSNFKEKQMLGMFISTMPTRIKVEENIKFIDLVKQLGNDTMSLFRHQKYPIEKTLEYIHNTTDVKGKIYNFVLSYQNTRSNILDNEDFSTEWLFSGNIQDDLEIHIMDIDNTGIFNLHYDYLVDLFDEIEIEYLNTRLIAIMKNAIKDLDINVENIRVMSEDEEDKILCEFNNTDTKYPTNMTVIDLFEQQVKKHPNDVAIIFENKQMTYLELNEKSNSLAHFLREEKKVKSGDIVSLIFKRSFEMIISILGILKSGAAYLPIDPEFPIDRIKYILENSSSKLIITNIDNINNKVETININNFNYSNYLSNNLTKVNKGEDLVYVIYTSGTTGKPKGVMISHNNLINLMFAANDVKKLDYCKVALSITKYFFDMFVIETITPLLFGIKLVFLNDEESNSPYKIVDTIEKYSIEVMFITPTKLNLILQKEDNIEKLNSIKRLTIAGEVFNKNVLNILQDKNIDIFNGYGPTETTVCSSMKLIKSYDEVNIGKPIPNTKSFIIDRKNRILPMGVNGELAIAGAGVGLGYINVDNAVSSKFDILFGMKVYKTGDEVLYNFDGDLEYSRRIDNQIKINGLRIEIEEIESAINMIDCITSSAVVVKKINNIDKIVCYVTINDKFNNKKEIIDKLSLSLPKYMLPSELFVLEEIPFNMNGKADRKKLIELVDEEDNDNKTEANKINVKDKKLSKILSKYNIDYYDSSYKKNIDSLCAIRLSMEISDEYKIDFTYTDIYECENIEMLEKRIREKSVYSQSTEIFNVPTEKEEYLLTPAQISIFNNYSYNTESIIYNTPLEIKLNNNINVDKLIKSIETSVLNHSLLFSKIDMKENKLYYKIDKQKIKINAVRLSNIEYIKVKDNFVKPFDLLNGRLFRIEFYLVEDKINILMDFHHIIFDGQSINILIEDIIDVYNDKQIKNEILTFGQCIQIENDKSKYTKSKKYFLDKLSDELPVISINTDYPRKSNKSFEGKKIKKIINSELKEKLVEYAKENNVTLNNVFLAIFNFVLSKYTYSEDIIIGIATFGRRHIQELNTIGMFVKSLPYRVKIDLNESFKEYLQKTQNLMLETLENNSYTYEEMVKNLKIKRDSSRNPIFNIMYVFQNTGKPDIYLENTKLEIDEIKTNTSKFDLTFEVYPTDKKIDLNLEYDTNLYKDETIERFSMHVLNALEFITKNKEANIRDVEIISEEEKEFILNSFNNTHTNYPKDKTIIQLFEEQVDLTPNEIAVVCENNSLTYIDLNEKANQLAHYLIENHVRNGNVVAIMLDKSIEMMIAILGILKCGAIYLPMDLSYPKERIEYIFRDSNIKVLVNKSTFSKFDIFKNYDNKNLNIKSSIDDLAYIMYTSGTTGEPKGVMVRHKSVVRLVKNTNYIDFKNTDRILQTGSMSFDAATFECFGALLNGLTLYLIKKDDLLNPMILKQYLIDNNITVIFLTTALFNNIVEYDKNIFDNVRTLLVGGEVLSTKHINLVLDNNKNIDLLSVYGPTENTSFSTYYKIEKRFEFKIPIGIPISNTTCYIYDKCNLLSPINVPGELLVGGDGVSNGYLNKEKLTNEKFIKMNNQILYKTGDLVYLSYTKNIEFLGRIDMQVKIRGFRIELEEIQLGVLKYKEINECYLQVNEINNVKSIVCYYTSNNLIDEQKLRIFLKNKLPLYMIPNYFMRLETLPLNINGKVDKSKLPDIKLNVISNTEKLDGIYFELAESFKEVLNVENIGMNDNFFEIGGDSLLVTSLVMKLLSKDIKIIYGDIFKYPTIRELGDMLNNINKKESISGEIADYDYSKINKILENNKLENYKPTEQSVGNVLLAGVTGFLGAHILDNFMRNEKGKIYCLIRSKNGEDPESRIKEILSFFFGDKYENELNNRIHVVEGDITNENIIADEEANIKLSKNIDTVINSAAHVKHYGNLELFYKINVKGTKNIVNFCEKYDKRLIQISTLSTSGNIIEGGQVEQKNDGIEKEFDETKLYIEQNLDNVYVYTKYIADKYILDEISENRLNAKIMRMGNLTGRYTDGKFQPNVEENAFANRIKTLINLKVMPENLLDFYMEFTPIDFASDAVMKLARTSREYSVFHLFNDKHAKMRYVINTLKNIGIDIKIISKQDMTLLMEKYLNSNESSEDISGIIADLNKNKELEYKTNIKVLSTFTKDFLKELNFEWPNIDVNYILKYIEYLKEVKFL